MTNAVEIPCLINKILTQPSKICYNNVILTLKLKIVYIYHSHSIDLRIFNLLFYNEFFSG